MDYKTVGTVGFSNLILLSCIIIWRWTKFYYETYISSESYTKNFRINLKKHANYALLLIASSCDLPMYVSFFELQRYDLITFSFHKFQSAALFGAYSLIISDWNSVLYEIQEESFIPFMCRNGSLIAVNALLTVISIVNFAYCYSFPDIDTYANSKIYVLGVFIQIIAPLFLTISMLWAGLKLSWRIQGASGSLKFSKENAKIKEFKSAVFLINMVMLSVCVTIGGQVTLLCLNYYYGYHSDPDKSVGPELLFWTVCEWGPVWVLTLAQLFLSRSTTHIRSKSVANNNNNNNNGTPRPPKSGVERLIDPHSSPRHTVKTGGRASPGVRGEPSEGVLESQGDDSQSPLLNRDSLTSSMQSNMTADYMRSNTFNGDLEEGRPFDSSASISSVYLAPQVALYSDYSMSQSDFLAHVRLSQSHAVHKKSPSPALH